MFSRLLPPLALIATLACALPAQQPKLEVASVKPTPVEQQNKLKFEKCPGGGRFVARGTPLNWVIAFAYQVPTSRIAGGPAWIASFEDAYDIDATASGPVTLEQCAAIVGTVLRDRFGIAVHKEDRPTSGYRLIVSQKGARVKRVEPGSSGGVQINGALQRTVSESVAPAGWTMARFASFLSDQLTIGKPVVDMTGLEGTYQFRLDFRRNDIEAGPDIFTALPEQLGLRLEPAKIPVEMLVLDRINRATAN